MSPHYIKVNQTPYYVDIDLWGEIDSGAATVRIDSVNKRICITAKRVTKEAWPQVLATGTKSELAARRAESVERQRTADAAVSALRCVSARKSFLNVLSPDQRVCYFCCDLMRCSASVER